MQYESIPTVISAIEVREDNLDEWSKTHNVRSGEGLVTSVLCETKFGIVPAYVGDFIIIKEDESYPIKAEDLNKRYRPVSPDEIIPS